MEKFVRLTATACPLTTANLNTDQILPARYLKWPRSRGLGAVLFNDLRFDRDSKERPDFPLNQPAYRGARILLAGRNFGGGSSREAAVYAVYDSGIRCVIAPSFGDIFAQNDVKNGLLAAVVAETVNEAYDLTQTWFPTDEGNLRASFHDFWLTLAWPTLILLLWPRFVGLQHDAGPLASLRRLRHSREFLIGFAIASLIGLFAAIAFW